MELFDVIKKIFYRKGWEDVSTNDKVRNFFMINRIMSIQWPIQAHQFNHTKIYPSPSVDWWHDNMSNRYTKPPQWIYTKTGKKESKKTSKIDFSSYVEAESFVKSVFEISNREIGDLKRFYPEKYESWIKEISEQIKTTDKN